MHSPVPNPDLSDLDAPTPASWASDVPASQEQDDDDLQHALRLSMSEAEVPKPVVI